MTSIRGLDARIAYVRAELYRCIELHPPVSFQGALINPSRSRTEATRLAERLGYLECAQDVRPPAMFIDVPELLEAWQAGYAMRIDNLGAWREHCDELWHAAHKQCGGGGYEWFQETFSCLVDGALASRVPAALHTPALEAIADLDYLTPAQRADWAAREDDGFCCHGIERYCCPAGCGDYDIGDD